MCFYFFSDQWALHVATAFHTLVMALFFKPMFNLETFHHFNFYLVGQNTPKQLTTLYKMPLIGIHWQ